jgi:flagellar hook assembly protein FlgD
VKDACPSPSVVADALVRVLAFSGEKVRDFTADAAGMVSWDGTNSRGENVGTGAYFVFIESGNKRRTLKVAVQR